MTVTVGGHHLMATDLLRQAPDQSARIRVWSKSFEPACGTYYFTALVCQAQPEWTRTERVVLWLSVRSQAVMMSCVENAQSVFLALNVFLAVDATGLG